jgi:hypothetical protein
LSQLAWTGVWTNTIEGRAARRRLPAFSPRWEEPLSVIQKDAPCRVIGFNRHDLVYQAVKWLDTGGVFAAAEEFGVANVPGGQVRARTAGLVFMFDAGATAWCCGQRGMHADASLDAGFLVRRQLINSRRAWCRLCMSYCAKLFNSTNRMLGRDIASATASASFKSFLSLLR